MKKKKRVLITLMREEQQQQISFFLNTKSNGMDAVNFHISFNRKQETKKTKLDIFQESVASVKLSHLHSVLMNSLWNNWH